MILHYFDYNDYEPVKMILLMDIIGFFTCFLFFMIMAKVIYKSSQVQRNHTCSEDLQKNVSLVAYMRSESAHEAKQSIRTRRMATNLGMVVVSVPTGNSTSNEDSR